jgi:putative FmdB family regulatory protein
MPTYEYACKSCGEHVEVVQSFKDDPLTECPACGGPLRKVFGNIGIAFKGSGFYKTDSRGAGKAGKTGSEGAKSDTGKSDTGKSDGSGSSPTESGGTKTDKAAASSTSGSSDSSRSSGPAKTTGDSSSASSGAAAS